MKELTSFVEATSQLYPTMWSVYDPQWRSPCETGAFRQHNGISVVPWKPLPRHHANDFEGLENALETSIHDSIKDYYGSYWSGCLEAQAPQGHVSLILLWNNEDRDRLIENLIGHALAQKRSHTPLSIFFACTDPTSEKYLAINNATGEIQLERPGYKPIRTIAPSLADFIAQLTPAPPYLHPERSELRELFANA